MRLLLHYTRPGDVVLDGFCGTGMTGVAAQMCGSPNPRLRAQIEGEMGKVEWGTRRAVLQDLSEHTTSSKTPADQALEPPAGSAHGAAVILRQPGGQHAPAPYRHGRLRVRRFCITCPRESQ